MEGLKRLAACVGVEHVAVVKSKCLSGPLVLGEVPAGGQLRLQSLWRHVKRAAKMRLFFTAEEEEDEEEEGDSPRLSAVNRSRC